MHHPLSQSLKHKTKSSGKIKQLPQDHFICVQNQTMSSDHTHESYYKSIL